MLNVFVGGGTTASESSQLTVALRRANTGMPGSDTRGQLQQQVLDYGNEFAWICLVFFWLEGLEGGHRVHVSGHKARCACHNQSERSALSRVSWHLQLRIGGWLLERLRPIMSLRPRRWMTCDTVGNTAGGGEMRQEETKEGRMESRSGRVFTNMQFHSFTPMMSMTEDYEGQKAATPVRQQSRSSFKTCICEGSKMRD